MAGITAPISTYSYKKPVANVAPGIWTEYAVNDLVTHIDHSRASVPIVWLTYFYFVMIKFARKYFWRRLLEAEGRNNHPLAARRAER